MLSRVAESLYWTGRYIERAEDTSRLLHANFHGLLDTDLDRGRAWRDLIWVVGQDELFREHFGDYTAPAVTEFLLWHPANPDAVTACVARARENARGVREQVSSEMWEHLNRLHLLVSNRRPAAVLASPHDFFVRIREGSHAFQGVMKATQPRGEAYEFLELGAHLERADTTARLLSVKVPGLRADEPASVVSARLTSLLKSCGAFEAYRRMESAELDAERVVAFLLLERRLPRAVCFCLELCLSAIRAISGGGVRPERAIGRIFAELAFTELYGLDESTDLLLGRVRRGISDAAD
ncbi:MAG TPA: alpha-E domain-containing protein, partial [Gaiellaceae bacterium]|nr:alpha-E domain-containing protein [Gaiellaceae bacterium]